MQNIEEIYDKYFETVNKYLFCLTRDADTAENLTQETFYRAVKNINKFKGKCSISTWLCEIAKNAFYDECKKTYENMKKDLKTSTITSKQEINYIKKYNSKMKILKLIIFIVLIALIIVLGRRAIIIISLQNKIAEYSASTNYHMTEYVYEGIYYKINEVYCKDNQSLTTITTNESGVKKIAKYSDGEKANIYIDANDNNVALLNNEASAAPNYEGIYNSLETKGLWDFILNIIKTRITTANVNGKQCYKVDDFYSPNVLIAGEGERTIYIDKETGLLVRTFGGTIKNSNGTFTIVNDYQYEFGTVTDEDLKEPDLANYIIQDNNQI